MLRHQHQLPVAGADLVDAMDRATWPARMQRLAPGPLTRRLIEEFAVARVWPEGLKGWRADVLEARLTLLLAG